jgi:DNA modification methylase
MNPFRIGDCVEIMRAFPANSIQLITADPPYNLGIDYGGTYRDSHTRQEFRFLIRGWLRAMDDCLAPYGSVYLFMGPKYLDLMQEEAENVGLHWRNTIVWHNTFGQSQKTKFTPSWTAILYYTKHPQAFTFNREAILVPSERQRKYNDKRAASGGKTPNDVWALSPDEFPAAGNPELDVWADNRVCGTFAERADRPTQLPSALCERIIRVSSNPGDFVLDPFAGSGSFVIAAYKNDRLGVGIELDPKTAAGAYERFNREVELKP